jgi:hypothetical protein
MIEREHELSITRQAKLLGISRGAVYYLPRPVSPADLALMRKIDDLDGRGAWRDDVFVERLWRSVKYERVHLKAYDSVSAARADIAQYLDWYNAHRAQVLERLTPNEKYLAALPLMALAA